MKTYTFFFFFFAKSRSFATSMIFHYQPNFVFLSLLDEIKQ